MTFPGWDRRILGGLGLSPTAERLRFLHAWAELEGGHASFNPLNTTYDLKGATKYNSAGVRHYTDPLQGVAATLLTLRLGYYRTLLTALLQHGGDAVAIARDSVRALDTWGTGGEKVLRLLIDGTPPASRGA